MYLCKQKRIKMIRLQPILTLLLLMAGLTASAEQYDFVVAQDGSGNYTTIQAAINAVPDFRKAGPTRILIKAGTYKEKIVIPNTKNGVELYGEGEVKLTYDDYASKPNVFGENMGTSGSSSVYVFCSDFVAENIIFENSSGPVGQAVACQINGDRIVFRHCRFLGCQDTLYPFGDQSRQYYEDCYIEGTVDFIFGKAQCVFNRCHIHSKGNGFLTAPATPEGKSCGFVFYDCRMTADEGVDKVYLSRPWRPYGQTVFIRCELGGHIRPEGWNNWGNPENEKTAYYAEYESRGPGANPQKRVAWSHQLTDLSNYDILTVLAGEDGWNPITH